MFRLGLGLVRNIKLNHCGSNIRKFAFSSRIKEQDASNQDYQSMMKDAYRQFANEVEDGDEGSILNLINKASNVDQKQVEDQDDTEVDEYLYQMGRNLGKYLQDLSPEEMVKRSKDFQRNQKEKRDWSTKEDLNKDYQDYSLFDKKMLQIRKTSEYKMDPIPNQQNHEFVRDLKKDVRYRSEAEDFYKFLYEDPKGNSNPEHKGLVMGNSKVMKDDLKDTLEQDMQDDTTIDFEERQLQWNNNNRILDDDNAIESDEEDYKPRLSLNSRIQMFDLYNQGWSIRDLSLRFGALPSRVKAIIYQWKSFFDEVFPKLDIEGFQCLLSLEKEYESVHPVVDYGVDLQQMVNLEQGQLRTIFKCANRHVDVQKLEPEAQERLKKLFEKKTTRKYDIVTEKFVGKGNSGYQIKSWLMYKTKSRPKVGELFQRVLRDSQKPYKLPKHAQQNLPLGPRMASSQYGQR